MRAIISNYLKSAHEITGLLSVEEIEKFARMLADVRKIQGTVFLIGNGGSASTASHFATDLGIGTLKTGYPVRVISLTDNAAVTTAISNDIDYESVFAQQIKVLGNPNDLLVLISASGNSKNLLSALKVSQEIGMMSFSLTGFDGGELRRLTKECNVHVPSKMGEYGLVEDAHLAICHIVTECIRAK
jgi:D-sedoheptulose 7-phosphate isomerase